MILPEDTVNEGAVDVGYLLERAARWWPDRVAVRCDGHERTYAQLLERAGRLGTAMRELGLVAGERVAVLTSNRVESPEIDLAIAYAGLVRVSLNSRLSAAEFSYMLDDAAARVLISDPAKDDDANSLAERHDLKWLRLGTATGDVPATPVESIIDRTLRGPRAEVSARAPAWISYTSGTTGRPKGVVLSNHALAHVVTNMLAGLGPVNTGDSILLPQPLSHGAGFFALTYLASGGCVQIMRDFDAEQVYALQARFDINALKAVPAMLSDLLEVKRPATFASIIYGAAPITEDVLDQAVDRFGPVLTQIYGQSEAPVTITRLTPADHATAGPHRRSAGRPWPTVRVEILLDDGTPAPVGQIGEVVVTGEHAMTGYLGLPEQTAETLRQGRVWTRDMAVEDDAGYLHLRGRRDDIINSGGYNIAPKEVEEAVNRHPDVEDCVAVGVPHSRWGSAVHVFVLLRPGAQVGGQEIAEFGRPALGFRRPRSVSVIDRIPRTSYGKVDREALLRAPTSEYWTADSAMSEARVTIGHEGQ